MQSVHKVVIMGPRFNESTPYRPRNSTEGTYKTEVPCKSYASFAQQTVRFGNKESFCQNTFDGLKILTGCSRCLRMILFMICEEAVYTLASLERTGKVQTSKFRFWEWGEYLLFSND